MKKLTCLILAVLLAGCAGHRGNRVAEDPDAVWRASHGRIVSLERMEESVVNEAPRRSGGTSGAGAVIGGVVGGVAGHQVGRGSGKDAATVVGAVAGAVIGNEIEQQNAHERAARSEAPATATLSYYRVTVRLDNGGTRTVTQDQIGNFRIGDRVRLVRGRAYAEATQP